MPYDQIPEEWTPKGHADPEGDVILKLDGPAPGQQIELKVSSQVMSRASTVFKAMFNPRFTGRPDFSSAIPLEVHLEEDDCQAMAWMCFAVHLHDLPEGRIPLSLLKTLAILVDKYDCAKAMQSWSRLWLSEWSNSFGFEHGWELFWMSYALQDHRSFWSNSEKLIYGKKLELPGLDGDSPDATGLSLLPTGLTVLIQSQRRLAISNMEALLDHIRTEYFKQTETWKKDLGKRLHRNFVNHFNEELLRLELTPSLPAIEKFGVCSFAYKLDDFRRYTFPEKCGIDAKYGGLREYSWFTLKGAMLGLCLLCVKRGKLSPSQDCLSNAKFVIENSSTQSCGEKRKVQTIDISKKKARLRRSKLWHTDSDEEQIRSEVADCNCMASTRREHERYKGVAE